MIDAARGRVTRDCSKGLCRRGLRPPSSTAQQDGEGHQAQAVDEARGQQGRSEGAAALDQQQVILQLVEALAGPFMLSSQKGADPPPNLKPPDGSSGGPPGALHDAIERLEDGAGPLTHCPSCP